MTDEFHVLSEGGLVSLREGEAACLSEGELSGISHAELNGLLGGKLNWLSDVEPGRLLEGSVVGSLDGEPL